MRADDLRKRFLDFFAAQDHQVVPSDSLIPGGDATVLFTSAGMNQFKDAFLGRRTDLARAASCQKCLRTGDLEQVGRTPGHHSFFEMLGNFAFGDYFKKEAIRWAWEFLTGTTDYRGTPSEHAGTRCLQLPKEQLWVSVYEEDAEALRLWKALGLPASRIRRFGQAENFWPANAPTEGPNGPCGPCSEIYFDPDGKTGGPNSVEVWNLVFTQFDRQSDGTLKPLARPCIDTGMGLERLARIVQGVQTDYETDLFSEIMAEIRALPRGPGMKASQADFAEKAIADHIRAIIFLIVDGVRPSNEGRRYVLRMLIRRAHRLGRSVLDIRLTDQVPPGAALVHSTAGAAATQMKAFLDRLVTPVRITFADSRYAKDLAAHQGTIVKTIRQEEEQFVQTLESGTSRLEDIIATLPKGQKTISGDEAFKLYDTYGFPLELTVDIARERGLSVDRAGFEASLNASQDRSRAGSQFGRAVFATDALKVRDRLKGLPAKDDHFIGYERLEADAVIQGLWNGTDWVNEANEGQRVGVVLERSPFYGEAGGQIGDAGVLEGPKGRAEVVQTTWADDVLLHHAVIRSGRLKVQERVRPKVDADRRLRIARSHTATHVLHWALRKVLGPEAVQAGSYNEAERLRFDFSSLQGLRDEQRHEVEALVNRRAGLADAVRAATVPQEEAKREGALALFGEKYGGTVRVVTIGDYSKELCGGTHLPHTGFIGSFLITGESSIAAGTRRIEAVVGDAAVAKQQQGLRVLHEAAKRLGRPAEDLLGGLEDLLEQLKRGERERKALQERIARVEAQRLKAEGKQINGVTFIAAQIERGDLEALTVLADALRGALGKDAVVLLAAAPEATRVAWVMATTKDLTNRVHAGELLKEIAAVTEGSGGGRPEFAQAGGRNAARIPEALRRAETLLRAALAR